MNALKKYFTYQILVFILTTAIISSCKKDSFITSSDARLSLSEDTLHFDTVFATLGSTTQFLKIFNNNDQKLKISSIQLMGGTASFFKLNVDGTPGTTFNNIEIEANDSIYLFATVRIDPNSNTLPFLVQDSVKIDFNGNTEWLQLDAFGKNANFMRDVVVTKDSTITNQLPVVILGSLYVQPNATLTITKGTQIFIHAAAPIIVDGSIKAIGDTGSRIIFQGIRIDDPYKDFPGSWPGIYCRETSKNNIFQQCIIKNAYQGVVAIAAASNAQPKVKLNECIFDNIYDIAIGGTNSSITAQNCLVSNVGYGIYTVSGGSYNFNHCTFAAISNNYLNHKNSLINLSNTNADKTVSNPLTVTINNSIIYGNGGFVDDEFAITGYTANIPFVVNCNSVLYKQKNAISSINFDADCIHNQDPVFDSIDISKRYYSFKLQQTSPCVDKAINSTLLFDIDKAARPVGNKNDLGCYESW